MADDSNQQSSELLDSEGRFWRIPKWFPELSADLIGKLRAYHAELIYFNGRMNLISPRTERIADQVHFADAILGGRIILSRTKAKSIFDLGSGNGIPGMILAALEPNRNFTLVDADARKIEFLKHCVARLGLKNCVTLHTRLEEMGEATISCAVNRGLASISKTLLWSRRVAAPGCEFFHFKGPAWSSEIAEIPSQILASWNPEHIADYRLPDEGGIYSIVMTRRQSV